MANLSTAEKIRFMRAGTFLKSGKGFDGKPLTKNQAKMYAGILAEANAKKYGIVATNKVVRNFRNAQKGLNAKYYEAKGALRSKLGIKGMCGLGGVDSQISNLPYILSKWKNNLESKNLAAITQTYSPDAILVSTFGKILRGRTSIQNYFRGLFKLKNLQVKFTDLPIISKLENTTMYTGLYTFSHVENNSMMSTKARYSILSQNINGTDYIIKQHSSKVPD